MKLSAEEQELVRKHRQEQAAKQAKAAGYRRLDQYTDAEKIKAFDRLHKMASDEVEHLRKHGHESKDFEHYAYEAVMELLGENIWDIINPLL